MVSNLVMIYINANIAYIFQHSNLQTPNKKPSKFSKLARKGIFLELENKIYLVFSDIKNQSHLYAEELSHNTNWPLIIKGEVITFVEYDLAFFISR